MKKTLLLMALTFAAAIGAQAATPILGKPVASAERMYQFVKSKSPGASFTREISDAFYNLGTKYGIRGDIALCQSCVETGWFRYTGGTAVTPDDHNYCGLGVVTKGQKGCQFGSVADGVSAQLQHLWAYATTAALPSGWTLVDPRFKYVNRGVAPNWEDLGGKWASSTTYGSNILSIYNQMMAFAMTEETPELTASPQSITLSAEHGAASPSKTVKITGKNLTSKITYNGVSSAYIISASNWDDMTGGTLTVKLDTQKAAGTYNGYIAVVSGTQRVEITINATITAASSTQEPTGQMALPSQFATKWSFSGAQGTSCDWFDPSNNLTRNMALRDGKLYVVQRSDADANVRIVDAATGTMRGSLPTGSIGASNWRFASVATLSDAVLACNLAFGATSTLNVYAWTSDSATPQTVLTTTNHGARSGDLMIAAGSLADGRIYMSSTTDYPGQIIIYTITNGTANANPRVITLKNANGGAYNLGGNYAVIDVREQADGTLLCSGYGGATALFDANGNLLKTIADGAVSGNTAGSAATVFNFGDWRLAAVTSYASTIERGFMNLVDITAGYDKPTVLHTYPTLGANGVRNDTFVNTALAEVKGNTINLYALIPRQGVACYTATAQAGVESVVADAFAPVQYYTLDGVCVCIGNQPSQPGLYVKRQGAKTTKVLIR